MSRVETAKNYGAAIGVVAALVALLVMFGLTQAHAQLTLPQSQSDDRKQTARSATIAHRWLAREYAAMKGRENAPTLASYQDRVTLLDALIDEAVRRVRALQIDGSDDAAIVKQFDEVDRVLVDSHYNGFIHTKLLWDALTPGISDSGGTRFMTDRMRQHRAAHPEAQYFRFDCDTGSVIYLAVFEVLGRPVVMVETPRHNFVRWRVSPDHHVNWDVNDARSYSDDEHRSGALQTTGPFSREVERLGHHLVDMSPSEVEYYHQGIVAGVFKESGQFDEAVRMYLSSIEGTPWAATPRNNLAWMIATTKELQRPELHNLAVRMAQSAVALRSHDGNFIDTLAAAYAARGDFDIAFQTEMLGRRNANRLKVYSERTRPADTNWSSEPPE